jgi:hypothetical protein
MPSRLRLPKHTPDCRTSPYNAASGNDLWGNFTQFALPACHYSAQAADRDALFALRLQGLEYLSDLLSFGRTKIDLI